MKGFLVILLCFMHIHDSDFKKYDLKDVKIILTGGNANFFKNMFENVHMIDDLFTSRGLHYLVNEFDK